MRDLECAPLVSRNAPLPLSKIEQHARGRALHLIREIAIALLHRLDDGPELGDKLESNFIRD
jgi:hypothetical protein